MKHPEEEYLVHNLYENRGGEGGLTGIKEMEK
jgi:hypothetical protein